jgi:hypothetical protein
LSFVNFQGKLTGTSRDLFVCEASFSGLLCAWRDVHILRQQRGLALPASDFFKGLLMYYGIEYLNLNPNGIFHVSIFIHFCEAFVGIKPHWVLFLKFFRLKPQPSANDPRVVGGAGIQMREDASEQYLSYKLIDSNQYWKEKWF